MTNEEAIKELMEEWEIFIDGCGLRGIEEKEAKCNPEFKKIYEAHKMAIQALEQEPKTGHWTRELIRNEKSGCIGAKMICSECNNDNRHDEHMNYCPNCGARMD